MSNLFRNHIVGFPMRRLICSTYLPTSLLALGETFKQLYLFSSESEINFKVNGGCINQTIMILLHGGGGGGGNVKRYK